MTLATSCVDGAGGGGGHLGAYKTSMLRVLAYVGLTGYGTEQGSMPERSEAENALIKEQIERVTEQDRAKRERLKDKLWHAKRGAPSTVLEAVQKCGGPHGNPTIYLSFEESLEWQAFLRATPPASRHMATVKRRLCLSLWRAHCRGLCLWCWFPSNMCLCPKLDELRASLPTNAAEARVRVTMVLHAEEVMRSTNSGHIAAYLLDAPVRIWGCPEDDAYLANMPALSQETRNEGASGGGPRATHNAALYPETNAASIAEFVGQLNVAEPPSATSSSPSCTTPEALPAAKHSGCERVHEAHLLLFDSTWGQALSLNRHINRAVPRVALDLDEDYESLFTRLRKRTREGGVSTLEATSMAVEQCIAAMGHQDEAEHVATVLTDGMKAFVDLKCLLKFTNAEFTKDAEAVDELTTRRDAVRRDEAARRYDELVQRVQTDERARALMPPPVLNYCYCCERVIGWHRMPEHVLGRIHRTALLQNPTCEPSEASRNEKVLDFERPPRRKKSPST